MRFEREKNEDQIRRLRWEREQSASERYAEIRPEPWRQRYAATHNHMQLHWLDQAGEALCGAPGGRWNLDHIDDEGIRYLASIAKSELAQRRES